MSFSWYRMIQIVGVMLIPGGLGVLFFFACWRKIKRSMSRRLTSYRPRRLSPVVDRPTARAQSYIRVPTLIGPPYVYVENLRK
jgi:hypothetical protein